MQQFWRDGHGISLFVHAGADPMREPSILMHDGGQTTDPAGLENAFAVDHIGEIKWDQSTAPSPDRIAHVVPPELGRRSG